MNQITIIIKEIDLLAHEAQRPIQASSSTDKVALRIEEFHRSPGQEIIVTPGVLEIRLGNPPGGKAVPSLLHATMLHFLPLFMGFTLFITEPGAWSSGFPLTSPLLLFSYTCHFSLHSSFPDFRFLRKAPDQLNSSGIKSHRSLSSTASLSFKFQQRCPFL